MLLEWCCSCPAQLENKDGGLPENCSLLDRQIIADKVDYCTSMLQFVKKAFNKVKIANTKPACLDRTIYES